METLRNTPEAVLQHHLEAFRDNDIEELMKDYTQESEVWGPDGAVVGPEAISSFYSYVFTLLPKENTKLELKQQVVREDKAYIVWSADSAAVDIPMGTDSFLVRGGKILWQSLAAHIIPKS